MGAGNELSQRMEERDKLSWGKRGGGVREKKRNIDR